MISLDTSSIARAPTPRQPLPIQEVLSPAYQKTCQLIRKRAVQLGFTRWFWGEGVCAQGMLRLASATGHRPPKAVLNYFDQFVEFAPIIEHVNNLAPGAAACLLFEQTGTKHYRKLADICLSWYEDSPTASRDYNGTLEHWPGGIWADTVYMAGSFLLQYGRIFNRPDLITAAIEQWLLHARALTIDKSGLIVHGTHHGEALPAFWGRANAWFALAGIDLIRYPAANYDHPEKTEIKERLAAQLHALRQLQPSHGVWDVLVDSQVENTGILETSATAGIGAAMLRYAKYTGDHSFIEPGMRATLGALSYVQSGWLTQVSAGTILQLLPYGYSVIRTDLPQPWGQGLALEAIAALNEVHRVNIH